MSEEVDFGWVPDILPKFERRIVPLTVEDPRLVIEILGYASYFGLESNVLCAKFIKKSLEAINIEKDPQSEIIEKDVWGRKASIQLRDQEYSPPNSLAVPYHKILARNLCMVIYMPSESIDDIMEIANSLHTTMEEVLKKMYIFGVKLARSEVNPEKSYIVRTGNQERRISLF